MPLSSKKAWQCSDKVRSGLEFSCSGSHCLKALPFTEGLPGILWIVTSPVRRLLLSQRLMVERETPKSSETSFLGMPRSIAESTFSLRSFEYAFMDLFLYRSATYASRCKDMEVSVQGSRDYYRGEVVPRYEFWLPPFGGCAVYYWDKPKAG